MSAPKTNRRCLTPRKTKMNTTNALRRFGLAGLGSILAAVGAPAAAQEGGYFYGGVGFGQSRAKIDEPRITASLLGAGLNTTSMSRDEHGTAYKLFGGYQINRNFGVEGGYFNLGKFGFSSNTSPAGTLNGQIKLQGLNLDLVGTLPLTDNLSAIARVGGQYASARDRFSGTGAVNVTNPNPSKKAANYKLGVGLQYEINRSMFVRAEGERYRINDAVGNHGDVNVFSVSLVIPFGRAPAATPRVAAAPVYVEPAPAPAPPPPPPPPRGRRRTGRARRGGRRTSTRELLGRFAVRVRQIGRQGGGSGSARPLCEGTRRHPVRGDLRRGSHRPARLNHLQPEPVVQAR